jgi:hypothetical protein
MSAEENKALARQELEESSMPRATSTLRKRSTPHTRKATSPPVTRTYVAWKL